MDMDVVRGGRPLRGTVDVSGSKNAALPIMAAALALDGPTRLYRVPQLADVQILGLLLSRLGVDCSHEPAGGLRLESVDDRQCLAPDDLVRQMRASICVLGPLLARRRRACVSLPGGCQIGHRPIDLHLRGLSALGADITLERGYIFAEARRLRGTTIDLSGPFGSTVTGTCNVLTAACLAEGRTVLTGAAREPEVVDLGRFLNAAGARITGLGSSVLEIDGVDALAGVEHTVISDRIEAATWLIAAAITGGDLTLQQTDPAQLDSVIQTLRQIGVDIETDSPQIRVRSRGPLSPIDVEATPYPGFPTDVQAQLSALLCRVPGVSRMIDRVFPDRFLHLPELCRMGAEVRRIPIGSEIRGVARLSGASVVASDLRAGAALLLAALAADGESVIRRVDHLDRGYERLEQKLRSVGADIQRVPDDAAFLPPSLLPQRDRWETPRVAVPAPHWNTHTSQRETLREGLRESQATK